MTPNSTLRRVAIVGGKTKYREQKIAHEARVAAAEALQAETPAAPATKPEKAKPEAVEKARADMAEKSSEMDRLTAALAR